MSAVIGQSLLTLQGGGQMQQPAGMGWRASAIAAFEAAQAGRWLECQQLCALTAERQSPAVMAVSRLNILICQYRLGHTTLVAQRALPLVTHLPTAATVAALGLTLLAAQECGTLLRFKKVVLVLASERFQALDLPTVPFHVLLHEDEVACSILEQDDAAQMSGIVSQFLNSGSLDAEETFRLESLASRYRKRSAMVGS